MCKPKTICGEDEIQKQQLMNQFMAHDPDMMNFFGANFM